MMDKTTREILLENVKEYEKTKNITLAVETMEILKKALENEEI